MLMNDAKYAFVDNKVSPNEVGTDRAAARDAPMPSLASSGWLIKLGFR